MWFIGQKVVCVNDRFPIQILEWASNLPRKGRIYTICWIGRGPSIYFAFCAGRAPGERGLGFELEELPNGKFAFFAERFAPLVDKLDQACQRRMSALTSPLQPESPVLVSAVQTRPALQIARQVAPARFKRRGSKGASLENAAIRKAVLRAAAQERRKATFRLFGHGHEPRVSLDPSVAAILRGLDVPRVFISGYGANYYYPRRVFAKAMTSLKRKFGRSPIAVAHIVYRVRDE